MNDENLEKLLRDADGSAMPLEINSRLVEGAGKTAQARRRRTRAGAVVAVLIVGGLILMDRPARPEPKFVAQATVLASVNPIALAEEIHRHEQTAQLLIATEKSDHLEAKLHSLSSGPGSEIWMQNQREEAARTLLRGAALTADKKEAAGMYRQAAHLFPDASAAQVANARLAEIQ